MNIVRRDFLALMGMSAAFVAGHSRLAMADIAGSVVDDGWLSDVHWIKANGPHGHTSTIRILPGMVSGYKKSFVNIFDSMVAVDSTELSRQFFYGDYYLKSELCGLSPRYSTMDTTKALSADNVMDAGVRRGSLTSAWIVGWGQHTVSLATRDGLPLDSGGNVAVVVKDYRYVVRIANIGKDVGRNELKGLIDRALLRLPTVNKVGTAIYLSGTMRSVFNETSHRGIVVRAMPISMREALVA